MCVKYMYECLRTGDHAILKIAVRSGILLNSTLTQFRLGMLSFLLLLLWDTLWVAC